MLPFYITNNDVKSLSIKTREISIRSCSIFFQFIRKFIRKNKKHDFLLEKNFVEKVTSIKVFNIIERDDLKSKIMKDFSIEIDFHDRNNSLGLKFSDNFCSIIRKNHSNLDNVKDFYTLITKNCNNIIDELIELL